MNNRIEKDVGKANYYLIALLMDIHMNMDVVDYSNEINGIEKIHNGIPFEDLLTFHIKQYAHRPSYQVNIEAYCIMNNELFDVTGIAFYTDKETAILSGLYYG